jgi:hypothetical protein
MEATNLSAADSLIGERIVAKTKKAYQAKVKTIAVYYTEHLRRQFAVPVQRNHILGFFGWLIDEKHKDKPAAISTVALYKSALKWHYKECKLIMSPEVNQELDTLLKGYQRRVADLKLVGKMPVFEGKYHLPFQGYAVLAKSLFRSRRFDEVLFGWPFLVLQWNLIARTATVSSIMMEHVGWEEDALLITTPKHKGDQEGVKCFARHLYANPTFPEICPVLALAIVTFARTLRHDPSSDDDAAPFKFRVFDGPDSTSRFSDTLQRCIARLPNENVALLGAEKSQLGTHSVRKGAASYCSGMMNGPSTVQVFLRAGWSLGNVQDRYLFAGAGGDQLTGRVLSGLPFNQSSFACLPPHFSEEGIRLINWDTIMPLRSRLPDTFRRALPHLLASICYHESWLKATLAANHPLFSTHLFASDAMAPLKPHLLAGSTHCFLTGMQATGIPAHLAMANELSAVVSQTQQLKVAVLSRCDELPAALTEVMLSKFAINGALPITVDNMKEMLSAAIAQMRGEVRSELQELRVEGAVAAGPSPSSSDDPRFQLWMWGGKQQMVPPGWRLPSPINLKDTWLLWHFGHIANRIAPLRRLQAFNFMNKPQVVLWSKTHQVMSAVAEMMVEMGLVGTMQAVLTLSEADSAAFFDRAIVRLVDKVYAGVTRGRRRWMEMKASTMYARLLKSRKKPRKRRRVEVEEEEEEEEEEKEDGGEEGEGGSDSTAATLLSQLNRQR